MGFNIKDHGFSIYQSIFDSQSVQRYSDALSRLETTSLSGGARGLTIKVPEIAALASCKQVLNLLKPYLGENPKLVRSVFLIKP